MTNARQRKELTFKANTSSGRYGWLRLTPAYSLKLVKSILSEISQKSVVFDPFSGTGTTAIAAAEEGHTGIANDVNPFLVWLGNTKLGKYSNEERQIVSDYLAGLISCKSFDDAGLWEPEIYNIERWWGRGERAALKIIYNGITQSISNLNSQNLLKVAFCKTLITVSNAAFNHQSMSFKESINDSNDITKQARDTMQVFVETTQSILEDSKKDLSGTGKVYLRNSMEQFNATETVDQIITSPPYANRMSYIRELRPYMYWLKYITSAPEAGKLDWETIGGTWGMATSKLKDWSPKNNSPIDDQLTELCQLIKSSDSKSGSTLANYVYKYHEDMWEHFKNVYRIVRRGGAITYIVGNSTFYNNNVPVQEFYAEMMRAAGFTNIDIQIIRKRNSNKKLYEYAVSATK